MKLLMILRHAKSSWKESGLTDHDRPLNKRGERDAPRMGRQLAAEGVLPELIVSSTAVRAWTTAREVAGACGFDGDIRATGELYLADPSTILELLSQVPDRYQRVMIVGHNPGSEELVRLLTGRDETMPTAALAQVRLPIATWSELGPRSRGELLALWRPKELAAEDCAT